MFRGRRGRRKSTNCTLVQGPLHPSLVNRLSVLGGLAVIELASMFYGHSCSYLECSPDPCVLAYPFPPATWHLSMSGPSFPCSFRVQFYTLPDDCAIIYSQLLFVKLNNNLFTVFLHERVYIYIYTHNVLFTCGNENSLWESSSLCHVGSRNTPGQLTFPVTTILK